MSWQIVALVLGILGIIALAVILTTYLDNRKAGRSE